MRLHIYSSAEELIFAYAKYFTQQAGSCIKEQGQFNVALSGGSSPKRVYELLASPGFRDEIDWGKVYFFFGDERHVPAGDDRNNALMVDKTLFKPLQISDDNIFRINTSLPPAGSARQYMDSITTHFKKKPIHFDLILLGLGDNAHTASLFPFTPVLNEKKPTVSEVYLKGDNTFRITLTAPLINQAKDVAFLVFGKNKAVAVKQVIKGVKNPEEFPAQLIHTKNGEVHWFLDKDAAGLL